MSSKLPDRWAIATKLNPPGLIDLPDNPTIPLTNLKSRRWDLMSRMCPGCKCRYASLKDHTEEECTLARVHKS